MTSYGTLGNIRDRDIGSRTIDIAYNANNQVSTVTDSANPLRTFTHDAHGNVANDGRYAIVYDAAEQPVSMTGSGVSAAYTYDGNKKRVKQTVDGKTTYFFYSALTGGLIYKDAVTDGKITDYYTVAGVTVRHEQNGANTVFTGADHLGSPVAAWAPDGTILWRETYLPFGETRDNPAANDNDTGFTGHIEDASTGLTYMQARYYDPVIGRFYSPDPIDYQDQLNLYAYVANDPVNATDPTGKCGVFLGACLGAAIGATVEIINPSREYTTLQGRVGGVLGASLRGAVAGQVASTPLLGASGFAGGAIAGGIGGGIGAAINCYGGGGSNCGDKIALGVATGLVGGGLGGAANALKSPQVSAMIGNMAAYAETAFGAIIDQSNAAEPGSGEQYGVTVTQNDDGTYTLSDPVPCSAATCSGDSLSDQGYYRDDDGNIRREN